MLPELVARCRALPEESPPLLILVDRRDPMVVRFREECLRVLVTQELDRLRNLRQTADRERFVLGRGLVRLLLGGWLDRSAREVLIQAGSFGKPFCSDGPEFNVSHSGDLILIGLHPFRPVGVDVEQIRLRLEWQSIVRRLWPDEVIEELARVPECDQYGAFTQYWCQFEAINKACGRGLFAGTPSDPRCKDRFVWQIHLSQPDYRAAAALVASNARGQA